MKTLLIETVTNGWIVRPFSPCRDWVVADRPAIAVFNRMIDLQEALPDLLAADANLMSKPAGPLPFANRGLGAGDRGGDRRSETIGGSELCPSS